MSENDGTRIKPRPRRDFMIHRWILGTFAVTCLVAAYLVVGPDPLIIISKNTTYITRPIRDDGLPDYEQFERQRQRGAIRPDENAAVLIWQALWPGELSPTEYSCFSEELGMESVPKSTASLERLYSAPQRAELADWLRSREYADVIDDFVDEVTNAALVAPWTSQAVPPLANWVQRNSVSLDMISAASSRPKYYSPSPSFLNDQNDALIDAWIPGVSNEYAAVRALVLRAMWHAGEGRPNDAWHDIFATLRLSQLFSGGNCLVEKMAALKTTDMALNATVNLLQGDNIDPSAARHIQSDLETLQIDFDVAESIDYSDRLMFLDAVLLHAKGKSSETVGREPVFGRANIIDAVSIDWNLVLRQGNDWYDRIVSAARLKSHRQRKQALDAIEFDLKLLEGERDRHHRYAILLNREVRSKVIGSIYISSMLPAAGLAVSQSEQAKTKFQLIQLAAALAVFRAERGEYPDRLDQLLPDVIPKLPVDLFHEKPFIYQRDADGYLLYSCGPNGDDGGGSGYFSNKFKGRPIDSMPQAEQDAAQKQMPGTADDISIRVPTPPFKLPTPPTNP